MGNVKSRAALGSVLVVLAMLLGAGPAQATVPAGFGDETVFEGLSDPTMVRFAPEGRIFVAEKSGKILVFENLQDETPEVFADLSKPVYDFEDHGLLGIALDPLFNLGSPYVYAIYTFNHKLADPETQEPLVSNPEGVTPAWPSAGPGFENDECTEAGNPGAGEGCEVSGLVVRMTAEGNHAVPSAEEPAQKVLLEGWCQQSTTHSIGNVGFGPEGNLFVSGGEGSMFSEPDYGEFGNPCEDPFEAPNGNPRRSKAEGGSLRSQSVLRNHTLPGHQTLLSGTVLRVDPDTGEGVPGNPFYATSTEKNAKRIIAFGFRQPWRFAFNPRTSKLFVDNVGDGTFEQMVRLELNGAAGYTDGEPAYNSGWPCYESAAEEPHKNEHYAYAGEQSPTLQVCLDQYQAEEEGEPETSTPFFSYAHSGPITPGDPCDAAGTPTDIGGLSFYEGSNYPAEYKNSLFFADPIRGCIYVMKASPNGEPDPASVTTFISGKEHFSLPGIDIEQGPEGDIFYTEFGIGPDAGTVHRITHAPEETHASEETPGPTTPEPTSPTPPSTPTLTPPEGTVQTLPGTDQTPTADGPPKLRRHPAKTTRSTTARFTFSAASGLTFRCSLDGTTFSRCNSPRIYRHLAVGAHSFRVFAVDSSGNQATATTKYRWTVSSKRSDQ
jgi:glucose/arabinose dehydrogenase